MYSTVSYVEIILRTVQHIQRRVLYVVVVVVEEEEEEEDTVSTVGIYKIISSANNVTTIWVIHLRVITQ